MNWRLFSLVGRTLYIGVDLQVSLWMSFPVRRVASKSLRSMWFGSGNLRPQLQVKQWLSSSWAGNFRQTGQTIWSPLEWSTKLSNKLASAFSISEIKQIKYEFNCRQSNKKQSVKNLQAWFPPKFGVKEHHPRRQDPHGGRKTLDNSVYRNRPHLPLKWRYLVYLSISCLAWPSSLGRKAATKKH